MSKPTALELAISKAETLPEAAREQIGREMLVRLQGFEEIKTSIKDGLRELEAGLGQSLDVQAVLRRARNGDVTE
jgi:hypothetical protein